MKKIKKCYVVKTWNELSDVEKQDEINKYQESICCSWCDMIYDDYKMKLDEIKDKYADIFSFDDLYLDENSQGWWIDRFRNIKFNSSITVYGEYLELYDINYHIRKLIDNIEFDDVEIYDYYIENDKLAKIQNTKKYKEWINSIVLKFNNFIEEINNAVKEYFKDEYNVSEEYVNEYMQDLVFEYFESFEDC